MLRLARHGSRALNNPFVCTSCRVLIARSGAGLPTPAARLCEARHASSASSPGSSESPEETQSEPGATEKSQDSDTSGRVLSQLRQALRQSLKDESATGGSKAAPSAKAAKSKKKKKSAVAGEEASVAGQKKGTSSKKEARTPAKKKKSSAKKQEMLGKAQDEPEEAETEGVELEEGGVEEAEDITPFGRPAFKKVAAKSARLLKNTKENTKAPKASKATATKSSKEPKTSKATKKKVPEFVVNHVDAADLPMTPVDKTKPVVPNLAYGLDRVLFNPGVYRIQDPRSRVFNFDPYLERIMPVKEFDFNALKPYTTSSKDTTLIQYAAEHGAKYTGSTSSMTSTLAHFHFLLSAWRPINPSMMSRDFEVDSFRFSRIMRAPAAAFLHWKDGVYAIDADKEFDSGNILSMLGKSMEKFLTMPKEEFEKYRRINSDQLTEEERNSPESFHYTALGDFLMRSQLDAHDHRLPGTGMFDLKTRAVISIRMDAHDYKKGLGYEIRNLLGNWESFEREYYDMIRSAFLKYSLQVRMGRMDGIFVAYHNTERLFGFQYVPLSELDVSLHGQSVTALGDREFKLSLHLLNKVLDRVTAKYPGQTLRLHFEARGEGSARAAPFMYIFAKPVTPAEVESIQGATSAKIAEFEREMMGIVREGERALDNEDGEVDEGLDNTDETDSREAIGSASATWDEVMLKVEDELEDEEHGDTYVREAIEDALKECGLLQSSSHEENQRHVDAFLGALTDNNSRDALEEEVESSEAAEPKASESEAQEAEETVSVEEGTEIEGLKGSEGAKEISEAEEAEETAEAVEEREVEETEESEEEEQEEDDAAESPTAEDSSAEEPTLKDLIVKLAARIRAVPDKQRAPAPEDEEVIGEDVPKYVLKLRKIEQILSELEEQPREGDSVVVDTGSFVVRGEPVDDSVGADQPAEPAAEAVESAGFVTDAAESLEAAEEAKDESTLNTLAAAQDSAETGEIFGLTLTARNLVNDTYVTRPENLKESDSWKVEYTIEEIKPERAKALYSMVLKRRRDNLARGRSFRRAEDEVLSTTPVHVYGQKGPVSYHEAAGVAKGEFEWPVDEIEPGFEVEEGGLTPKKARKKAEKIEKNVFAEVRDEGDELDIIDEDTIEDEIQEGDEFEDEFEDEVEEGEVEGEEIEVEDKDKLKTELKGASNKKPTGYLGKKKLSASKQMTKAKTKAKKQAIKARAKEKSEIAKARRLMKKKEKEQAQKA
ncbi:mitochondrial protein Pet127-domain-containing protein [Dichotomopilus funicola]|uniref:Mitochondrial protein Pet127-domain-containing protein n=1 Tax=Dichotomopilus funicola TaxID=1934379 RepID=A0AAN6ZQG7_9PEZI|nr:mitochondrial protein Pet127-domain-containing protein [Dichotomopilus funicola]